MMERKRYKVFLVEDDESLAQQMIQSIERYDY